MSVPPVLSTRKQRHSQARWWVQTSHRENRQVIFRNRNSLNSVEAMEHKTATGKQKLQGAEMELEVKGQKAFWLPGSRQGAEVGDRQGWQQVIGLEVSAAESRVI